MLFYTIVNYTFLSTYSNYGYPSNINLDENNFNIQETISSELISEISNTLTSGETIVDTHPDWIRKSSIMTTDTCDIKLTFIGEGAGYKNALSYYIHDIDNPPTRFSDISDIYIIFPNASKSGSGGNMSPGDTIKLAYEVTDYTTENNKRFAKDINYIFPKDKGVSFVIHSNQWKNNGTSNSFLRVGHHMYSSDPMLNPEPTEQLKNHFINFKSTTDPTKIIYGAEDILRTKRNCDHDFDDLLFYITPSPIGSIAENTYNSKLKQEFTGSILCEDLLNRENADLDYDDFCAEYNVVECIENDKIISITFTITGLCRGATLDHDFGVVIPKIKNMSGVEIIRETYIKSTNTNTLEYILNENGSDRIAIIKSTKNFLPSDTIWATNTIDGHVTVLPSYVKMKIIFPGDGVSRSEINNVYFPYNFYLRVYRDDYYMWDLYSDEYYTDVSSDMKAEGINEKKKILLLEGVTGIRYPYEKKPLRVAYYNFLKYLKGDKRYQRWYLTKWAKEYLLYPKIEHTDDYAWNEIFN